MASRRGSQPAQRKKKSSSSSVSKSSATTPTSPSSESSSSSSSEKRARKRKASLGKASGRRASKSTEITIDLGRGNKRSRSASPPPETNKRSRGSSRSRSRSRDAPPAYDAVNPGHGTKDDRPESRSERRARKEAEAAVTVKLDSRRRKSNVDAPAERDAEKAEESIDEIPAPIKVDAKKGGKKDEAANEARTQKISRIFLFLSALISCYGLYVGWALFIESCGYLSHAQCSALACGASVSLHGAERYADCSKLDALNCGAVAGGCWQTRNESDVVNANFTSVELYGYVAQEATLFKCPTGCLASVAPVYANASLTTQFVPLAMDGPVSTVNFVCADKRSKTYYYLQFFNLLFNVIMLRTGVGTVFMFSAVVLKGHRQLWCVRCARRFSQLDHPITAFAFLSHPTLFNVVVTENQRPAPRRFLFKFLRDDLPSIVIPLATVAGGYLNISQIVVGVVKTVLALYELRQQFTQDEAAAAARKAAQAMGIAVAKEPEIELCDCVVSCCPDGCGCCACCCLCCARGARRKEAEKAVRRAERRAQRKGGSW